MAGIRVQRCLAAGLALAVALAGGAMAAPSEEEIKSRTAEEFGAEVLRMEEAKVAGRTAWLVTLMRHGGNDNAAFKVDTVAIDAETGEPLRGRIGEIPGAENVKSMRTQMIDKRPEVLRGRPWR
ncbi:PepSY domain-containing protein [Ferruginivarius sediminum]|uniref:PepSY domain-containing protein n=1 Tax=Ferruginivarius sediminum TaxID=2661937 RepID=A0A369TC10_9PROT|nr:PepSY domain-containing protein [Ferruginivarius sediminum]RDD62881.1 hypothetical protein DRB17_06910 [Ferruginivarius sediminum]